MARPRIHPIRDAGFSLALARNAKGVHGCYAAYGMNFGEDDAFLVDTELLPIVRHTEKKIQHGIVVDRITRFVGRRGAVEV